MSEMVVKSHRRFYKKAGKMVEVKRHGRKKRSSLGMKSPERYIKARTPKGIVMLTEREMKIAKKRTKKMKR